MIIKPTKESLNETIAHLEECKTEEITSAPGYPGHHQFLYIVNIEQHFGKRIEKTPISYFQNKEHAVDCAIDEYRWMKNDGLFDMDVTTTYVDVQILNN